MPTPTRISTLPSILHQQALGDIAVARGVRDVDRCLAAELTGGLVPGLDPELQQKPVVDMLLDLLHQWARDFAEAAKEGSKKRVARRGSRDSGEDLAARGVLGAAVVEALARLVRSHLRWQAREEAEGRELAMEDMDVVKVRDGCGGWRLPGWGRWGRAPGFCPGNKANVPCIALRLNTGHPWLAAAATALSCPSTHHHPPHCDRRCWWS